MTEQIRHIASRIKELRLLSGLSPETLAHIMGISKTTYLEYEEGNTDIPVSFLLKIAHYFKVELSALLSGENPRLHVFSIVRKGKGLSVERRKEYKYENLAFNFIDKKAEPFLVTVEPEDTTPALNSHTGQEFNFILEGTLKVVIDDHEIILNEGDSLYFDSGYKHSMKALNNKTARFLAFIV
jgi:transcriptional regulator with XRE-family HTH domain